MTFQVATSGAHHSAMQPDVDKGGELRQAYPLQDKVGQQFLAVTLQDTWACLGTSQTGKRDRQYV